MKCKECAEQFKDLDAVIAENKNLPGPVIQTLHSAQKIFGFLPNDVLIYVADKLGRPVSEVYGVATFYHLFHLKPKGEFQFKVCLGTACYIRGGQLIVDLLKSELGVGLGEVSEDRMFSVEAVRCIGACGLAPALMVNEKVYDRLISPAKVRAVIKEYRQLAAEAQRESA
ncbi:MAG: NAD(P)H-dependent oxidoreductase subunit E [bacterium]|nr:NAD(P)H-dependent oxidoreductase subunit E [bacterium]